MMKAKHKGAQNTGDRCSRSGSSTDPQNQIIRDGRGSLLSTFVPSESHIANSTIVLCHRCASDAGTLGQPAMIAFDLVDWYRQESLKLRSPQFCFKFTAVRFYFTNVKHDYQPHMHKYGSRHLAASPHWAEAHQQPHGATVSYDPTTTYSIRAQNTG